MKKIIITLALLLAIVAVKAQVTDFVISKSDYIIVKKIDTSISDIVIDYSKIITGTEIAKYGINTFLNSLKSIQPTFDKVILCENRIFFDVNGRFYEYTFGGVDNKCNDCLTKFTHNFE